MLGRTHMAIGGLGAALLVPVLLHDANAHAMVSLIGDGKYTTVRQLVEGIVAGALGGIIPDLDQKDGLMTRQVEKVGQFAMLLTLIALLVMLNLWKSPIALGITLFIYLSFVHHAEWVRKTSLIILALASVYFELRHPDFGIGASAAIWFGVTAFSKHRTFTHSLLGFAVAAFALVQIGAHTHLTWLTETAILGYGLHILADAVAGGIPLLWPFGKRQGIRMVLTGGKMDHLIGSLCALLTLVYVVM